MERLSGIKPGCGDWSAMVGERRRFSAGLWAEKKALISIVRQLLAKGKGLGKESCTESHMNLGGQTGWGMLRAQDALATAGGTPAAAQVRRELVARAALREPLRWNVRIGQVRHRSYATYSRQPRQVRKEATVTGSCVCSESPVPDLFCSPVFLFSFSSFGSSYGGASDLPITKIYTSLKTLCARNAFSRIK